GPSGLPDRDDRQRARASGEPGGAARQTPAPGDHRAELPARAAVPSGRRAHRARGGAADQGAPPRRRLRRPGRVPQLRGDGFAALPSLASLVLTRTVVPGASTILSVLPPTVVDMIGSGERG